MLNNSNLKNNKGNNPAVPISNYIADSVIVTSLKGGEILYANDATKEVFGYDLENIIGEDLAIIGNGEFTSKKIKILREIAVNGSYSYVLNAKTKEGVSLVVEINSKLMPNYAGERALVHTVRDITEKRKMHEETLNLNAYLAQQTRELEEVNKELRAANATKDKFISIIAHDLRGPISGMSGLSDIVRENLSALPDNALGEYFEVISESKKFAEAVVKSGNNTLELLDDLMKWSSMQHGSLISSPTRFYINELVQKVYDLSDLSLKNKKIEFISEIGEKDRVYADYNMTKTIIRNLINNATKFTESGGTIQVKSYKSDLMYCIEVCDNGVGMSADKVQHLFDLDKKQSTLGTAKEKGTGFGLQYVEGFTRLNEGRLEVESELGKGTVFRVYLPMYPSFSK